MEPCGMVHLDVPNPASPERLFADQPVGLVPVDGESNMWHNALDSFDRASARQVRGLA